MKRLLCLMFCAGPLLAARVEIREGRFYVDGSSFYVKGVGYAPWRPHQHPGISYTGTNRHWTKMDFERMKAAHFNTVRTWDALDPEDLALARNNGLMVLQGIWLDPKQDFSDPHNQQAALAQVQGVAAETRGFDNVLGYVVMTEPSPQAVLETGAEETLEFFRKLKRAIQTIDPRPVSMDSWPPLAFMNHHDFDFVTFNLFAFWPKSLLHAMRLSGITRWFADHLAEGRPLVVGETGGFSVSQASQTAAGGFGGLSEYDQSLQDLDSLRDTLEGHAAGSVLVSWIDTWHYPANPDRHDNEPWEWDGILGIATDSLRDMDGVPRQIYQNVSVYNLLIPIEPKDNHSYSINQPLPIQVNGSEEIARVRYSLNDGDWTYVDGPGHGWFLGSLRLPKLSRKRLTLALQGLDKDDTVLVRKSVSFLVGVLPERLTLESKKNSRLEFSATIDDGQRRPIERRKVDYGCFYPVSFKESRGTLTTDAFGRILFACGVTPEARDRYVLVAAGTDSPEKVRTSDLRIFKLGR